VNLADTAGEPGDVRPGRNGDDSRAVPAAADRRADCRAGRAMLGAIPGSSRAGEQTLLRRLVRRRPDLVAGRVICFDRNFPGYDLITAILDAGGHVVARVKAGISLPAEPGGGWLPDGSRVTWLNAPSGKEEDRLAGPRGRAQRGPAPRRREGRGLRDLYRDHHAAGPRGRARGRGAGGVPDPVERVGDHVRRGTRPPSRRPGTAPAARCCGRGPRGWSSRKPGPG